MDVEERMTKLEILIARHEERLEKLEDYQAKQNGHLCRLEQKMDKIFMWLIGLLGCTVASLAVQVFGG